jgi:soluble lytic murein transglycosylase
MAGHGFPAGERKVDAEFFAGWAPLVKLNDPVQAARHFEALRQMSSTPITQGRAFYWLGRAAEAQGNTPAAIQHYRDGRPPHPDLLRPAGRGKGRADHDQPALPTRP